MKGSYAPLRMMKEILEDARRAEREALHERSLEGLDEALDVSWALTESQALLRRGATLIWTIPLWDGDGGPSSELLRLLGDRTWKIENETQLLKALGEIKNEALRHAEAGKTGNR